MSWSGMGAALVLITGVYAALVSFLYLTQSRLIYFPDIPSRDVVATPAHAGMPFDRVGLSASDGVRLDGWYIASPPGQHRRGVVLFLHGNAGNISHRIESLRIFYELGFDTLIFDYRGYGRSEGRPSERGTYLDAEAAWRYLTDDRQVAPKEIVLFGRSLGGAIAAYLASQQRPGGLIVESAATSIPDLAAQLYPFLPARQLSRFDYSTKAYLQSVNCPVLIVHSRDDEIVPFGHGEQLFAQARDPKVLLVIRGGHNDGFWVSGRDYVDGLDRFLGAHVDKRGTGSGLGLPD